jgi:glycosyltransferase involved in cell wall biosynthesis
MANLQSSINYKISIITVVKNADAVIQNLFKSVRAVKTEDIEFVVLDGGSTDKTINLLKKNEDIIDTWQSDPDNGIYYAMNKAVGLAKGEWMIFIGADDELLPGFKKIILQLKETNSIYYGKVLFHNKVITGPIESNYHLSKTNICHQAVFYPKAAFYKYSYETRYIKCADYVLNLKLWGDPDFKFVYCNELIAKFPEGGFSTNTIDVAFENDKEQLFKQHLKLVAYTYYLYKNFGAFKMIKRILLGK